MSGKIMVRAKYISDIPDDYLKKGKVYLCFYVGNHKYVLGYRDEHGEAYGVPADRFEILEEIDNDKCMQ